MDDKGNEIASADARVLRKYMPALDVLRGVAILSVLCFHELYWSGGGAREHGLALVPVKISQSGWLGVNLFFVLSGFLITGILVDSKQRDDYFHRFYWRRALRILPAYLLILAAMCVMRWISARYLACCLLFLANYWPLFHGVGGYGPFWSLSVEEQFYLFWPLVVRKVSRRSVLWISVAICLIEPVLRWATDVYAPRFSSRENTFLIVDNLALGALAALFVRSRFGTVRLSRRVGIGVVLFGLAMAAAGYSSGIFHRTTVLGSSLQSEPWNFVFTGLLLFLLSFGEVFARPVWAPLRFLGYISYGLYLVHVMVIFLYDNELRRLGATHTIWGAVYPRFLIISAIAIGIAWVSRHFYEDRFLRIKVERGDKPRILLRQEP